MIFTKVPKTTLWYRLLYRSPNFKYTTESKESSKSAKPSPPTAEVPPPSEQLPPPKKSRFLLKFTGFTVFATAGVVVGCYLKPEFRSLIESLSPTTKYLLSVIFAYIPPIESENDRKEKKKQLAPGSAITDKAPPLINFPGRDTEPQKAPDSKVVKPADKKEPVIIPAKSVDSKENSKVVKKTSEVTPSPKPEEILKQAESRAKAANAALTLDLNSLSNKAEKIVNKAVAAQKSLESQTRQYAAMLKQVMDEEVDSDKKDEQWFLVSKAQEKKQELEKDAAKEVEEAKASLELLKRRVESGAEAKETRDNVTIKEAQRKFTDLQYLMQNAQAEAQKAISDSYLLSHYKDLFEKSRNDFKKELQTILPDVDFGRKDHAFTEHEYSILLGHAYKRLETLQRRIANQESLEKAKVIEAQAKQKEEDNKETKSLIERELEHQKNVFALEKRNWETDLRTQYQAELNQSLMRQSAIHSENLTAMLKMQRDEISRQYDLDLRQSLLKERHQFQLSLENWTARVKGIETAVEGRAEIEKRAYMSQALWLACQSLLLDIHQGKAPVTANDKPTNLLPVQPYLEAITSFADNMPFVQNVVSQLKVTDVDKNVISVESLLDRFHRVKDSCKHVSVLDERGANLIGIFVNWFQSKMILDKAAVVSVHDDFDVKTLDTYTILASAEECVKNGDLENALRFMAQLKGCPRVLANDWIQEACRTLEVVNTAKTLTAFAASYAAKNWLIPDKDAPSQQQTA